MINQILVPLDGSALAEEAIPAAVELAKTLKAGVTLIHVIEKRPPSNIHGQTHLQSEAEASLYLERIAGLFFSQISSVQTHVHPEPVDKVAESITNHILEYDTDLLVMCTHGNGGLRDMLYGSIAQQIIANKKIPVLIIHPQGSGINQEIHFKNILIPVDGNPEHEQGFVYAVDFARAMAASLNLLLVVPTYGDLSGEQAALGTLLPLSVSFMLDELETAAETYLSDHIDQLCNQNIDGVGEIRRGDPVDEIVRYTQTHSFDMVVVGTHGKSGADAFWAGSKAAKIISRIKSSVLVVPVIQK